MKAMKNLKKAKKDPKKTQKDPKKAQEEGGKAIKNPKRPEKRGERRGQPSDLNDKVPPLTVLEHGEPPGHLGQNLVSGVPKTELVSGGEPVNFIEPKTGK